MIKLLAKMAEKYAKATNTACMIAWIGHQIKDVIKHKKSIRKKKTS